MHTVLITGGAGFIGSHLAEKFARESFRVVILDNLFRGKLENVSALIDAGHPFYRYDLVSHNGITAVAKVILDYRPTFIFHYAAINGTQYFYEIPEKVAEANSIGTYNLMRAMEIACKQDTALKPLLVFASTSETYGEPYSVPTKESDITYARISEDRDSYAVAKLMSEFYVKLYARKLGFEYIIFRIFNVYGPRMIGTKYGQVIPEFIERLSNGEYPLSILGNGEHTRSFIYIDDHVELAYRTVAKAARNTIYNLGNPVETSIKDLGILVMEEMGKAPAFNFLEGRRGDHTRRVPDIAKLLAQSGPFEFIGLREGIRRMLSAHAKHHDIT